jgi:pimeloyl-ACP methyl ester carboxylesterase
MFEPCYIFATETPKKYILNGLWFGPEKPKKVIIFVHGLTSSAFNTDIARACVDADTASITFNNRGNGIITKLRRKANTKKGTTSYPGGTAHEVFTESVDDIQGIIDMVKSKGVKEIYLMGHSTGCQKSVFYMSRSSADTAVKGIILLAPMSDYADAHTFDTGGRLKKTTQIAEKMVQEGKKHNLLPYHLWSMPIDAQRFLSLYTPESKEEIFCYAQEGKIPTRLKKVCVPMLVLLAGDDEYRDRPIGEIAMWFEDVFSKRNDCDVDIILDVLHNFGGAYDTIGKSVGDWVQKIR